MDSRHIPHRISIHDTTLPRPLPHYTRARGILHSYFYEVSSVVTICIAIYGMVKLKGFEHAKVYVKYKPNLE